MKIIDRIRAKRRAKASAMLQETADNIKECMEKTIAEIERSTQAALNDPSITGTKKKRNKEKII